MHMNDRENGAGPRDSCSIAIREAVHIEAQSSSVINVDRSNRGTTNNFTLYRFCSDFIRAAMRR